MEVRYRRELNETYMILKGEDECEEYAREILRHNRLEELLELSVFETDGVTEYGFQISRGNSLYDLLAKRPVHFEEIRQILFGLARTVEKMEEYLLDYDHLILEPEFIYGFPDCAQVAFCCHPAYRRDFFEQLRNLIQYFLSKLDHTDRKGAETAYELFQASRQENFRFEDLLEIVGREIWPEERESAVPDVPPEKPDSPAGESAGAERERAEEPEERDSFPVSAALFCFAGLVPAALGGYQLLRGTQDWRWFALALLFFAAGAARSVRFLLSGRHAAAERTARSSTSISDPERGGPIGTPEAEAARPDPEAQADGETRLLTEEPHILAGERRLVSENVREYGIIRIDRVPFSVGKRQEEVDGVIDSPVVSRIHARLDQQEGQFFLTDCHSTNGTRINGTMLAPGVRCPLQEGDEVTFADRRYVFR